MTSSVGSTLSGPEGLLIGGALILMFIVRQFMTRPVLSLINVIVPLGLLFFGVQGLGELDSTGWLLLGINISLAIALGVVRAMTFRVWVDEKGQALMRGRWLTVVLWIVTIGVRAALTFLEIKLGLGGAGTSTASSLLAAAATIGTQLLVLYLRAQDQRAVSYQVS